MPAPLSPDIRHRFQVLCLEGHSAREIGRRLLISAAPAVRFADCLRRTGGITPKANPRRQGHGRLVPCEGFFAELVEQDPDITLKELRAALLDAHGARITVRDRGVGSGRGQDRTLANLTDPFRNTCCGFLGREVGCVQLQEVAGIRPV